MPGGIRNRFKVLTDRDHQAQADRLYPIGRALPLSNTILHNPRVNFSILK